MNKTILLTFADPRYKQSLKRLEAATRPFPLDERHFLTPETALSSSFWRRLKPWLYRRGYGYWAWKAAIVQHFLLQMQDGDVLVWSDAGIHWNASPEALNRFRNYLQMLDEENDMLVFQQPTVEQEWTKGDVLQTLGVYQNDSICLSPQLWAGCFFLKKTPRMMLFVDEWNALNDLSRELITDKASNCPNKSGFKEHRHDQSIFSVLVKLRTHIEISHEEVIPADGDWKGMDKFPIQGRRLKEKDQTAGDRLRNKLMRPWREILHLYFRYIRNYEYQGCYHW